MIRELCDVLNKAGYVVSGIKISAAYIGKLGSRKLYGVWSHRKSVHWAARKLEQKGVVFDTKPEIPEEQAPLGEPPPEFYYSKMQEAKKSKLWVPHHTFITSSLPGGDQD